MKPEDVPGLISEEQGAVLEWLAESVPKQQVIVELGAYLGRSTAFLARGSQAGQGARIISIDPHGLEGSERGMGDRFAGNHVRTEYLNNLRRTGALPLVTPIRALSKDAPLRTVPIGLLWIDGDHSGKAVHADVRRFAPLVASGGWIVLDDFHTHHKGVDRVVRLLRKDPRWTTWHFLPRPLAYASRR
jgi:predicted O-methyltransferase YrrM